MNQPRQRAQHKPGRQQAPHPSATPASTLCPLQRGQGGSTNLAELVAQLQLIPTPHQPHEIQGLQPESLHPVLRQQ